MWMDINRWDVIDVTQLQLKFRTEDVQWVCGVKLILDEANNISFETYVSGCIFNTSQHQKYDSIK